MDWFFWLQIYGICGMLFLALMLKKEKKFSKRYKIRSFIFFSLVWPFSVLYIVIAFYTRIKNGC